MRPGKWSALLPPLLVVVAWTDFALAQGTKDLIDAGPRADEGVPNRMILASGILTFGSTDDAGAIIATRDPEADAARGFGPFTIIDSLFNPDKGVVSRSRGSLAKPTICLSPAALGAGGYGMLATATF
jgi:hypothetical protein